VIAQTDIKHIVLETDSPYLPPVPHRGKRNEPLYLWETAAKVAWIYNMKLEEIVEITRQNSLEVFKK
jgi:TatD DNase family protein